MQLVPTDYDLALQAEREIADRLFDMKAEHESATVIVERDIRSLAKSLFLTYFDVDERDEVFFGPESAGQDIVEEYCEKAEKIYNFFNSNLSSAQRLLEFLKAVDPKLAQQIVDSL